MSDVNRVIARLTRGNMWTDAAIAEIYQEKGLVYLPAIGLFDVNRPDVLVRVMDGLELQMMGIRG